MTAPHDARVQELLYDLTRAGMNLLTGVNEDYVTDAIAKFVDGRIADANAKFVRAELAAGRDAEVDHPDWARVREALDAAMPGWNEISHAGDCIAHLAASALACRAQQRENAETIKALKGRVETAEAANTALDNARKSAEQSARDLRENNATLRAELDAIKGAQREVRFAGAWTELTARYEGGRYAVSSGVATNWCDDVDAIVRHWPAAGNHRAALEALRHPAPALPVVGACVFNKDGQYIGTWSIGNVGEQIKFARQRALGIDGTAYRLYRDVTPLPTEGGK